MQAKAKRGLGRGLNALFEDEENVYEPGADGASESSGGHMRLTLGVEHLTPGKSQPRQHFDEAALQELADSIKTHGLLQPLLVRAIGEGSYEIIAGERRWRAAQKAQIHEVPVIVLDIDDEEALEIALVENLQREDLSPIEEAKGYQRLMDEYGHTQEKLGEILGKSRSHIANMVRLLSLPQSVLGYLENGEISIGHARAILPTSEPESLAKHIIKEGLTVRQAETLAMEEQGKVKKPRSPSQTVYKDANTVALEDDLANMLGMRVIINSNDKGAGTISVHYKSLDQLDEVIHRLTKIPKVEKLSHNPLLPVGPDNPYYGPEQPAKRLLD